MAYFRAVREGLTDACVPAVRLLRTEETSLKKLPFISPLFVIVLAVALTGCGDKVGGNAQATASNTPAASATPAAQPAAMPGT